MTDAFLFLTGVKLFVATPVTIRLQRDIDELLASRKPLAIAGKRSKVLSAFYCLRPLEEGGEPVMFLFHAGKKSMPRSHDRNKQKRRMREAVKKLLIIDEIRSHLQSTSRQALILLRATKPPSADASWETIAQDMEVIALQLRKAIDRNA